MSERFCPCCGQPLGLMSDGVWHVWLATVRARLRAEGRAELAEALAAIEMAEALELEPPDPGARGWEAKP